MNTPACPLCRKEARTAATKYGLRHECCGLHSWDGKPLVSQDVHDGRQAFHKAFDGLWNRAEVAYEISEEPGTRAWDLAAGKIKRSARNRAYLYIADKTKMPEPACHGSEQEDVEILARLTEAANQCSGPLEIRAWFKKRFQPQDQGAPA